MKYSVIVMPEAERNLDIIYDWIAERSPEGARKWYQAYRDAIERLEEIADRCSLAREAEDCGEAIREYLFRTKRGHRYRLIFKIVGSQVHVLYLRGYGQADVAP